MMDPEPHGPLASLYREHRVIAATLDALAAYTLCLETGGEACIDDLRAFSQFFTELAELRHHVKEEDILLPQLVRHGFAWDTGPIEKVRSDHDQERYLMRVLQQAGEQELAWTEEDRRHAIASIRAFIEFQRTHMEKEEAILYPAVLERLSSSEQADLARRLDEFDARHFGSSQFERFERLALELSGRYRAA